MQAKLLRFLQNGEVKFRCVSRGCACGARDERWPAGARQAKQFRLDLYYRLAIFPIAMPPLRKRPEGVPALAEHFLEKLSTEAGVPRKYLMAAALHHCKSPRGREMCASCGRCRER
jgi:transcriptional regulator with GAF, ATPase, and Fis domain